MDALFFAIVMGYGGGRGKKKAAVDDPVAQLLQHLRGCNGFLINSWRATES